MKRRFMLVLCFMLVASLFTAGSNDGVEAKQKQKKKANVKPGVEVLIEDHLDWLEGKRVGLITNPTGVDRELNSTIDLLYEHPDVNLTALFGAEHGIRGDQEAGEYVESYIDEETGLPVYSLYGSTWKPTEEMLEEVDVLLFDIQDIGSNVYTYIYTLGFAMEAAGEMDKEVIVLDRPNPIGGERVEGPLRSEDAVSFMGRFLLPVRHGMTPGELATMWNHEYSMGVNLKVAKMKGWKRDMHFEDTGLPWVQPSPNIPTQESAYLYAGTELVDDTTLSTGLGTTKPFEQVGAPWIDAEALAEEMKSRDLAGVNFRPAYYTPMFGKYQGERVAGVQVHIEDPSAINLVALGLHLVDAMRDQNPEEFDMTESYTNLIGSTEVPGMILENQPVSEIMQSWEDEQQRWVKKVRNNYLLYGPYPKGAKPYKGLPVLGIFPLDLSAAPGEPVDLTVKGYTKNGERMQISEEAVSWEVEGISGHVEEGTFTAEEDGTGTLYATYEELTAERQAVISTPALENIRYGVHPSYSRIVLDLNKTTTNYELERETDRLLIKIPYGAIQGELDPDGGTIQVSNSPVISEIDYFRQDGDIVVALHVDETVEYETPAFSSRIVLDLQH
ncbi:exo-beta-N-acetylmuramidase NamZ family protein [Oceanobacillus kapialis]|uniref:Exo-beta-N-acetylmuramidase NamZ domain-containing protein n=1 Tax=Oceanobacillus kapialis TaxID=481353 RepID=A0ABW5Q2R6_9BACI